MHENLSLKSGVRSIGVIKFDVHLFFINFRYLDLDRADKGKQNISLKSGQVVIA